jgi:HupE / UreJ protein
MQSGFHEVTTSSKAASWTPPSRMVESAIALSIAYVGIENFFVLRPDKRWRVAFLFGLLHGFAFAAALRSIAVPRAEMPIALLSFNVGVELGQLGVLALVLPCLSWLRQIPRFEASGARTISGVVAVTGAILFLFRILQASV